MPRNHQKYICTPRFMFTFGSTLIIFFFFLTQMCTKRFVKMRATFCENILTCF